MKHYTQFEFGRLHYENALRGIQFLEEIAGPDTLEEYVSVMTSVMEEIKNRIETAKIRMDEGEN